MEYSQDTLTTGAVIVGDSRTRTRYGSGLIWIYFRTHEFANHLTCCVEAIKFIHIFSNTHNSTQLDQSRRAIAANHLDVGVTVFNCYLCSISDLQHDDGDDDDETHGQ